MGLIYTPEEYAQVVLWSSVLACTFACIAVKSLTTHSRFDIPPVVEPVLPIVLGFLSKLVFHDHDHVPRFDLAVVRCILAPPVLLYGFTCYYSLDYLRARIRNGAASALVYLCCVGAVAAGMHLFAGIPVEALVAVVVASTDPVSILSVLDRGVVSSEVSARVINESIVNNLLCVYASQALLHAKTLYNVPSAATLAYVGTQAAKALVVAWAFALVSMAARRAFSRRVPSVAIAMVLVVPHGVFITSEIVLGATGVGAVILYALISRRMRRVTATTAQWSTLTSVRGAMTIVCERVVLCILGWQLTFVDTHALIAAALCLASRFAVCAVLPLGVGGLASRLAVASLGMRGGVAFIIGSTLEVKRASVGDGLYLYHIISRIIVYMAIAHCLLTYPVLYLTGKMFSMDRSFQQVVVTEIYLSDGEDGESGEDGEDGGESDCSSGNDSGNDSD